MDTYAAPSYRGYRFPAEIISHCVWLYFRYCLSFRDECLNRMIFVGQASLRRAVSEYMANYHGERNHQGLDNRLIRRNPSMFAQDGRVSRRARLGGMLNFYCREAA